MSILFVCYIGEGGQRGPAQDRQEYRRTGGPGKYVLPCVLIYQGCMQFL